jgi:hypothetical protein
VGVTITGYGTSATNGEANMVPGYTSADWDNGITNVSSPEYHTLANVLAGRGDPCKLVGLTIEQIQSGNIDNGDWRLPTDDENRLFVGYPSTQPAGSAWYTYTPNGESAADPGVGTFPHPDGTAKGAQLPAASVRVRGGGKVLVYGMHGAYWSSTPPVHTIGYNMVFDSQAVYQSNSQYTGHGCSIRCVPQ